MFYKLSNTCELGDIENEFRINFQYPNLYEPQAIINGLNESNVTIITSEKEIAIDFAIWGLLPENYEDNWDTFQDFTNTLNTNIDDVNLNKDIYSKSLDERRCLIIVNGFFTSILVNGKLQMHHVHLKNHQPFCIAGIYNKTTDGFLTCSLLVTNTGLEYKHIPNLGDQKPLIFTKKDYRNWLNSELTLNDLRPLVNSHDGYDFKSHPIEDHFYDNSRIFKRITNSNQFQAMMHISRN